MTDVRYFLGIDPGKSGGLAVVDHLGLMICTRKMPETERDLIDLLQGMSAEHPIAIRAIVERVSASPQMGVVSAFTFGKGYGGILMALTASRIPFDQVTPNTWQSAMSCKSGGDKNVTKRRAQQLFPSVTVTHALADALLLAEYCRRYWCVGDLRKESANGKEGTPDAGAEKAHGKGDAAELWEKYEAARAKIGDTVTVRLGPRAEAATGRATRHRADPKPRA